jgi:hypothetical protein
MAKKKSKIKLTPPEFAKCWGRKSKDVHTYKARGFIKFDKNKYIDLDDPINEKFVQKLQAKGQFDLTKRNQEPVRTVKSKSTGDNGHDKKETVSVDNDSLEAQKIRAEIENKKARTKSEQLRIQKLEGNLIPIQEVETLFIYAIESFQSHYEQEIESILNTMSGNMDISHERYVELRKDIKAMLTNLYNETRRDLLNGVKNLAEQYSEVRGKGEKK